MATRLSTGSATATRVRLRCWGDFALTDPVTGADLKPRGRKARALFAYLALHPGKPVSREKLMGLLWGDRADEQARASLRQVLFELRGFANGHGVLAVTRDAVTLDCGSLLTDIMEMRKAADAGNYDGLLALLPEPDDVLLASLDGIDIGFDEWLQIERTRQRDTLVTLIADASASAVSQGQVRVARALHFRLVELTGDTVPTAEPPPAPTAPPIGNTAVPVVPGGSDLDRRTLLAALVVPSVLTAAGVAAWWLLPRDDGVAGAARQEARGLYESAMPMIRERREARVKTAGELLQRAVTLDPEFAKGWAGLAMATSIGRRDDRKLVDAEGYARRALRLDPDLAEGHAALGMILGFAGPEAGRHLKRAAALNPRDAQTQFWLSNHFASELDFAKRLDALRKVVALDPHWPLGANMAALAAWEMGYPDEARRYARRLLTVDRQEAFNCDYQLDLASGEYAAIVKKLVPIRESVDRPVAADLKLGTALLTLGHVEPARLLMRLPASHWEVVSGKTPSPAAFRAVEAASKDDWLASNYVLSAALQAMLRDGRSAEIAARFDSGGGHVAELGLPEASRSVLVGFGPDVALALDQAGRKSQASALIERADRVASEALAQGPVPNTFQICLAKLRAVQSRRDQALTALGTAIESGWHYTPLTPLPDIGDISTFRALRGDSRFEAYRGRLRNHLERERRMAGPAPI